MNGALLGSKYLVESGKMFHAVVPSGSSFQSNVAPPQLCTGMPRWSRYQALSALGSRALKKTPPMPVTRLIYLVLAGGSVLFQMSWVTSQLVSVRCQTTRRFPLSFTG